MSNNICNCLCGEDSTLTKALKVSKVIFQDPDDASIQYELYIQGGQLYQKKVVTEVVVEETILYNTSN